HAEGEDLQAESIRSSDHDGAPATLLAAIRARYCELKGHGHRRSFGLAARDDGNRLRSTGDRFTRRGRARRSMAAGGGEEAGCEHEAPRPDHGANAASSSGGFTVTSLNGISVRWGPGSWSRTCRGVCASPPTVISIAESQAESERERGTRCRRSWSWNVTSKSRAVSSETPAKMPFM